MKKITLLLSCLTLFGLFFSPARYALADDLKNNVWLYTQTDESRKSMTADVGLNLLKEGNARFVKGDAKYRNLLKQAKLTSKKSQYPFAVILSCMDSRGSPELIFDQGIGDVFSIRVAGNVLDADQIGGLEYATRVIGSHLIVVMGHTQCGAVAGACSQVELGDLTQLLAKIQPAVTTIKNKSTTLDCQDGKIVDAIAKQNVLNVMQKIKNSSPIINDLIKSGEVKIIGAMHNLRTGEVAFFE